MAQSPASEKSEGPARHQPNDGPHPFKIASPPEPTNGKPTGRSAAQGVSAAYQFADASRRDAGRN